MEFKAFFAFHLKFLQIIGFRFKFGDFPVPKRLRGNRHFWFCQSLTVFLLTIRVVYLFMLRSNFEYVLFGSCGLIYVVENFVKSQEIQRNSDKVDAILEKFKTMFDSIDDRNDSFVLKYFRIFRIYVRSMFVVTILTANIPLIGAIVTFLIRGEVLIKLQGVKFMPFNSLTLNIVVYIPQYFCALLQCFYPILDSLMMMLSIHLIFQFRKISEELQKLKEERPADGFIKTLVDRHTDVLRCQVLKCLFSLY